MVFNLASSFEFSAASKSTTCPWSAEVAEAAGLSGAEALDAAGLPTAFGGAALS
jgi:hypothetical protein